MYFGIQVGIILRTDVPLFPLLLLYFYHSFHGSFMKTRCPSLFQYIIITAFIRTADVFMRHPQVQASSLQATWPSLLTCYQHRATITRNTQKAKKEVRPSFLPPSLPDNLFYATKHTLTQWDKMRWRFLLCCISPFLTSGTPTLAELTWKLLPWLPAHSFWCQTTNCYILPCSTVEFLLFGIFLVFFLIKKINRACTPTNRDFASLNVITWLAHGTCGIFFFPYQSDTN